MPQPVRLCNPHLRSHRDYLGGSWVGHSGHLPDGQEATPSELCWAPAGMPPHRAVWTHTAATLPTLQECCEMPQTTALCEVTRSWYGSKAESGVQILRYWDSSSTVPLLTASCGIHANWNTATIQGRVHALPPFPHQPFSCLQHCNPPWFVLELEKDTCTW